MVGSAWASREPDMSNPYGLEPVDPAQLRFRDTWRSEIHIEILDARDTLRCLKRRHAWRCCIQSR
jgi:hypothetical protein